MIYNGLGELEKRDVPDEQIELVGRVIGDYIAEDGLSQGDVMLERLMRYGEEFLLRHAQVNALAQKDFRLYDGWTKEQAAAFNDHTKSFAPLYSPLSHLTQPPNFLQGWALCFLVDIGVRYAADQRSVSNYAELSDKEREDAMYIIRFGENMLVSFKEAYERQKT